MLLIQFATESATGDTSVLGEAWSIFTDPSHIIAELGWTLIQDVVVIWLFYGIVFKKMILPRLRREIHQEIDEEHNISHDDD